MIGSSIGNYRVERLLSEGGMGKVYLAVHPGIGRAAAVKILPASEASDPQSIRRFLTEARASNAIRHPNIVDIYDSGVLPNGTPYIVMEYLEGETLSQVLMHGQLPIEVTLDWACQVAEALATAHAHDIVHRDLKPENLFMVDDPRQVDRKLVKVLDFGIAKLQGHESPQLHKTQTGSILGTPLYMSPEQCLGSKTIDARSDIYSFGVILYEMVCGRRPFDGETVFSVLNGHINAPPAPPRQFRENIPETLESLILRSLAKNPAARPASMAEVLGDLELARGNPNGKSEALKRVSRSMRTPTPIALSVHHMPELRTLGDTAVSKGSTDHPIPPRHSRWYLISSLGLATVLLVTVFFLVQKARKPVPSIQAASLPIPTVILPKASTLVNVFMDSQPQGAAVSVAGVVVGTTPFVHKTAPSSEAQEYQFQREGHASYSIRAVPSEGLRLMARLQANSESKGPLIKRPKRKSVSTPPPDPDIKFER